HLPKLVRAKTQESIEVILRSLWRTRKSGLDAAEKAHLQDLLQLPSHEELDPVSLPRLKAMTWSMENQNSTPANRVAVINLK
ncbi:hypothetical protein KI387_000065, partial [Taxus chinensis]